MEQLLEEINQWYHDKGGYPTVKVSREFDNEYWKELVWMANPGDYLNIIVDDNLKTDWELV